MTLSWMYFMRYMRFTFEVDEIIQLKLTFEVDENKGQEFKLNVCELMAHIKIKNSKTQRGDMEII